MSDLAFDVLKRCAEEVEAEISELTRLIARIDALELRIAALEQQQAGGKR